MEAATRICSCRYGEAQKVLKRRRSDYLKFLWKGVRYNLGEERDKFQAWSDDYNSPPTPEGGCQSSESTFTGEHLPHEIWIVTGLMTVLGFTEEQAWMTPPWQGRVVSVGQQPVPRKGSNILLGQSGSSARASRNFESKRRQQMAKPNSMSGVTKDLMAMQDAGMEAILTLVTGGSKVQAAFAGIKTAILTKAIGPLAQIVGITTGVVGAIKKLVLSLGQWALRLLHQSRCLSSSSGRS